ncbi:MAG: DEAD/DEAH box helicase [Nanoarchaeota archaeon]
MINLEARDYQKDIFNTAIDNNTLVVLPTGLGKTLIAMMLSIERLKRFPASKSLILAPTKPLVEQHLVSFKKQLPELFGELTLFTGEVPAKKRQEYWENSDIIFSTPQCIANDIKKGLYNLKEVSLIVIDEAHRCLKNYDYTNVVNYYKQQAENPRILGLTASPGSEQEKVRQICKNLDISEVEIRSRDSPDVKQYLQELDFKKIEVPFPQEFIEIRILLNRIYESKVFELKSRRLLFGPVNKITLLQLQNKLAMHTQQGDGNSMYGMSLCAQAIKISHAVELLETQTLSGLNTYLNGLIQQSNEKKSRGVQTLVKSPEFNAARISLQQLLTKSQEHPKIEKIHELVENEFKSSSSSKILIFTQFRETASTIIKNLETIPQVKASIFIGQSSNKTKGLSQKEQKEIIEKFRENELNVLCATSIGEEGLDIPEVSAVLFYEPIPSAIRKIQRAGRTARHAPGKLFILVTKDTRDEANHYAAHAREKKMYRTIESIKKEIKLVKKKENLNGFL